MTSTSTTSASSGSTIANLPTYETQGKGPVYKTKEDSMQELQDNFLKLLTTQLQYQDPMKPMENTEFTSQMAQFSMVTQQKQSNGLLENLLSMQKSSQFSTGVDYLGRLATVKGDRMEMTGGQGTISFSLPAEANVSVSLVDQNGNTVKTLESKHFAAGDHEVTIADAALADGRYTFRMTAIDKDEKVVEVEKLERFPVTGVVNGKDGVTLDVSGREVALEELWRMDVTPAAANSGQTDTTQAAA